ncbi:hypothetical protein BH11BAC1_BH11BAC1_20270 [soil metagenome]
MKKHTFLLLFCFTTASIFAQNWQTVVSNRSAFFYGPCSSSVRALLIDSTSYSGTDSILYSYRGMSDVCYYYPGCFHSNDTLWPGIKILISQNGDNIFFNNANDSIIIKTAASLNDTWRLFEMGNGDYISGAIDSIKFVPVLGIMDSVKNIKLTARNSSGTTIAHNINGHYIKISKDHGLVTSVHLFSFPNEQYEYSIIGLSNPALGLQNLTAREIFNLDTGDIFQYSDFEDHGLPNYSQDYKELKVLNKSISANLDTFNYTFDRQYYHYYKYFNWDTSYFVHDTEMAVIAISTYGTLNEFPNQVHQVNAWPNYGFTETIVDSTLYNLRRIKKLSDFFELNLNDSCYTYPVGHCIFPVDGYAEGLGHVSKLDWDGGLWPCHDYHLVYFQKGAETWGTPLDWPTILKIENNDLQNATIYPNPFTNTIEIRNLPSLKTVITISDETGRTILNQTGFPDGVLTIPANSLSNGIYFLNVQNDRGSLHSKLIKQ